MPKVTGQKNKAKKRGAAKRPALFTRLSNRIAAVWRGATYRVSAAARLAGLLAAGVILIGLGVAWSGGWLDEVKTAVADEGDRLMRQAGFRVLNVDVAGAERTDPLAVREALNLDQSRSILSFDAASARDRVESLSWVRHARITRLLPDRIQVRINERTPTAIWQREGALAVLDEEGAVIAHADAEPFSALPLIVGGRANEAMPELLSAYALYPELAGRVEAAQRVGERRWTLWIDTGLKVHLPENAATAALAVLDDLHDRRHILDAPAEFIDLRDQSRIVIRPLDGRDTIELYGREA